MRATARLACLMGVAVAACVPMADGTRTPPRAAERGTALQPYLVAHDEARALLRVRDAPAAPRALLPR